MAAQHLPLLPQVFELMATGMSSRKACEMAGFPFGTLYTTIQDEPYASQYAGARASQAQALVSDLAEASQAEPERLDSGAVDSGEVAHRRLKIDTLKWIASKILPREYGDRQQLDHTGIGPITVLTGVPQPDPTDRPAI